MKSLSSLILALMSCTLLVTDSNASGLEEVFVYKIIDDNAIVVRENGDIYLIEKGIGCLSMWRYENDTAVILSPGLFAGIGSTLILPDEAQECRIWDSELLGNAG